MKTGFNSILGDAYNRPYLDDYVFLTVDGMEMKVAGVFPVTVRKLFFLQNCNFSLNTTKIFSCFVTP